MISSRLGTALVLISAVIPVAAQERTPQEQINKVHRGSKVMVQLKNQNTVVGCLVGVTDTNFTVELASYSPHQTGRASCSGSRRSLLFQDVSSIRQIREMPKAVAAIAVIPVVLICGIDRIFSKNACDEL